MRSFYQMAFLTTAFLSVSCLVNPANAQQEDRPDVTDMISRQTTSFDSTRFVQFLKKGCQDSSYLVGQVQNWNGLVAYRGDLQSYVISATDPTTVYPPNTAVCGYYTYIICDCDQAAAWLGQSVSFSGKRYQARGVRSRTAQERFLYLHITAVRRSQ